MNKYISIIISVILILSSAIPVFATDTDMTDVKQPMYFAMGDSVSSGCKMSGTQKAYDAYKTMSDQETKYSQYISPVDGQKHNHWYINAVPYSFVSKFARSINASEDSMNGAQPGLRPKDYCYILGLIDKSEFKGDVISGDDFTDNSRVAQYNSAEGYKYAIKNADVITVQLGENDISEYMYSNSEELIRLIKKIMPSAGTQEATILNEMQSDLYCVINSYNGSQIDEAVIKVLADLARLGEDSKSYLKIIEFLITSIAESADSIRSYWNILMKYIYENKKDGAIVIATTVFAPFPGLENHPEMLGYLTDGMDANVEMDKVVRILTKVFDPFVEGINRFYRGLAARYDYVVAEVPKLEMISVVRGEYDPYDEVYLDTDVTYLLHPNHKESDKILYAVQDAYKKAMAKRGENVIFEDIETAGDKCQHSESEIRNVAKATYLKNGYSGDKVCTECGRLFYKGEIIPKLRLKGTTIRKTGRAYKSFNIKWDIVDKVSGYQIQYSTSSNFERNNKKVTIASRSTTHKQIKKLKSGKKYYVRVRTYKNVKNNVGKSVKVYSAWSGKKAIRTK